MQVFIAALPLVVAILLLAALQWSALQTSIATLVVTVCLVLVIPTLYLSPLHLLQAFGVGFSNSLTVLTVLFPALLLYQLQAQKNGMNTLARGIARIAPARGILILLIVLGLTPFIECVSGFGVGTVVVIPILVAAGNEAIPAALLGLLGQLAVPWGALAVGTAIGAQLAGLDPRILGANTALITAPLPIVLGCVALFIGGGRGSLRRYWPLACIAGAVLVSGEWLFSLLAGIELAGVLASLISLALIGAWGAIAASTTSMKDEMSAQGVAEGVRPENDVGVLPSHGLPDTSTKSSVRAELPLWRVVAPYAFLTLTLLVSRLVTPFRLWLQTQAVIVVPTIRLQFPLLYTPGFWLLLSACCAVPVLRIHGTELGGDIRRTWRQFFPGAVAILCFLIVSEVMSESGMTALLGGAAARLGGHYGWIAPWLGALGGWLTGSNAGGNAMFALLQKEVSVRVGLPLPWIMGAQNGAGSIATMASPARTILAATTVGLLAKESLILRKIGPVVLCAVLIIMLALVGLLTFLR